MKYPLLQATRTAVLCGIVLMCCNTLYASEQTDSNVFSAEYFTKYSPNTALDMVSRVPGFTISFAENKRGLGQGGANVLINTKRITGKTDVSAQLGRIAANNVIRIEVLDGASLDIPGLSGQVANIITKSSGITGTWSWEPEWRHRQPDNFSHVHLTLSGEHNNWSYSSEIRQEYIRNGNWGTEFLTLADGTLFETRDEQLTRRIDIPGANIGLTWKPDEDRALNINLEYNQFNFSGRENSARNAVTADGETLDTVFTRSEDETNGSLGIDYEFPISTGKLKLIGYYRFEESPVQTSFESFDRLGTQARLDGSRFTQQADESEAILRSEFSWSNRQNHDWQIALEAALNELDITADLQILDENGNFVDEPLDGANSIVEENRAEVTITHSRKLSEKLDLQITLGTEYSEITQTGGLQREFTRPKGFIASTYKVDDSFSIRAKIEREVGQLNFFDFISSISVIDDINNTGNVNLIPSQSWRGELEFDKSFGQGNSLVVNFFGSNISDLVDRIPIGIDGDAVGNIDSAYQYGVNTDLTVQGDQWGWVGTELKASLNYQNSGVDDPLTGVSRRLNGDEVSSASIEFRHDLPSTPWAYGFLIEQQNNAPVFRINNIRRFDSDGPFGRIFVEHKDFYGMKINAAINNIFERTEDFTQRFFTERRDLGTLDFTESRSRNVDIYFNVKISGTF